MNGGGRPTDRRTDRRDERPGKHLADALPDHHNATDSLPVVSTTASSRRRPSRRLADHLSTRDRQVLDSLRCLRLLQATQIERLHFREGSPLTQARRARATLARLHELALVSRLERRIGGVHAGSAGYIYRLAPKGRRLLELSGPKGGRRRQPPEPTVRFQDHVLAVAELAVQLREHHQAGEIELLGFEAEPACWRRFSGVGGERVTCKPDAFAVLATGDYEHLAFIEVDLGTEGMTTIRRKGEVYRRYAATGREQGEHGVFPRVVFLTQTERRQRLLASTLRGVSDDSGLFGVGRLDDPLTALVGGAS